MEDIVKSYTSANIRYEVTLKALTNIPTSNQIRITWKMVKTSGKTKTYSRSVTATTSYS